MTQSNQFDRETLQWLAERLAIAQGSINLYMLPGDVSSRRYYRVRINQPSEKSFVLCQQDPFDESRSDFLYIQRLWASKGIRVPEVYFCSGKLGLILLQDLGDITLQKEVTACDNQINKRPNVSDSEYFTPTQSDVAKRLRRSYQVLNQLYRILQMGPNYYHRKFSTYRFGFEFGWSWRYLVKPILYSKIGTEDVDAWVKETKVISGVLGNCCWYPVHRDFHSRNIMVYDDDVYFIDFQDARLGPVYYDLVSYSIDCYLEYEPDIEQELIRHFHQILGISFDHDLYRIQAIQRLIKAAGSFASVYHLKNDRRYLGYIPQALRVCLLLLEKKNDFPCLRSILNQLLGFSWENYGRDAVF